VVVGGTRRRVVGYCGLLWASMLVDVFFRCATTPSSVNLPCIRSASAHFDFFHCRGRSCFDFWVKQQWIPYLRYKTAFAAYGSMTIISLQHCAPAAACLLFFHDLDVDRAQMVPSLQAPNKIHTRIISFMNRAPVRCPCHCTGMGALAVTPQRHWDSRAWVFTSTTNNDPTGQLRH
jgi:hypothetical protein